MCHPNCLLYTSKIVFFLLLKSNTFRTFCSSAIKLEIELRDARYLMWAPPPPPSLWNSNEAFNHSFSIHLRLIEISFIVIISQKWFLLACNGAIFTNGYDLHKSSINLRSYALLNINWCFHVSQFVTCQNKITTKKTFFTIDHWILFVEIIYKQLCSIAQWAFRNKLEIKIV